MIVISAIQKVGSMISCMFATSKTSRNKLNTFLAILMAKAMLA